MRIEIDKETRVKHARLHSAGHLIDLAVQRLSKFFSVIKSMSGRRLRGTILPIIHMLSTRGKSKM